MVDMVPGCVTIYTLITDFSVFTDNINQSLSLSDCLLYVLIRRGYVSRATDFQGATNWIVIPNETHSLGIQNRIVGRGQK